MIAKSVLNSTTMQSPLAAQSVIKPKSDKWKRSLIMSIMLTSLVDAFSILVLYLLSNYSTSGEFLLVGKDMQLPVAAYTNVIERQTVVKVESGKFYVEDKATDGDGLTGQLLAHRQKISGEEAALIIQADKRVTYDLLSQVVHAGSQAGFGEIKFAVLAEK